MTEPLGLRFTQRSIVVTGGSSGIGLAVARRVAREGGRALLMGRRAEPLEEARASLAGEGHLCVAVDCADEVAVAAVKKTITDAGWTVDGLALCAGAHDVRPLHLMKSEHADAMWRANISTALVPFRALLPTLTKGRSSVVGLSSIAAVRGGGGVIAYSAAKAALEGALRVAAVELATRGVRVNWVRAGVVETPMSEGFLGKLPPDAVAHIKEKHLLGFGSPDDVAAAVTFLLSDDSRWMTGTGMDVDGGLSCR